MPDEYWTKIGNTPKPKKTFGPRSVPVPPAVTEKSKEAPDGSELYWCPSCKADQREKKWREKAWHTRCRGCGTVIYPKHEKKLPMTVERRCKVCQGKLRRGNGSGKCALCDRL